MTSPEGAGPGKRAAGLSLPVNPGGVLASGLGVAAGERERPRRRCAP